MTYAWSVRSVQYFSVHHSLFLSEPVSCFYRYSPNNQINVLFAYIELTLFNAVGLGSVWLYFTIKKQDNKVKHKIKETFLIAIAAILSISYVLIYGLNPLNHNHQLLCIVGMGGLIVLQFIGERFLKMRRVMHWLIIMPILIILYFLI